jgi:hypothetical protein
VEPSQAEQDAAAADGWRWNPKTHRYQDWNDYSEEGND